MQEDKKSIRDDSVLGEVQQFFGVYFGRLRQEIEQQYVTTRFGFVWSSSVIDDVLKAPRQGSILL
jgi:hypothetical protein